MNIASIRFILVWCMFFGAGLFANHLDEMNGVLVLTTLYGSTVITEHVLIDLIKCPAFERLKHINQYGVTKYAHAEAPYTRYEHSLGVLAILRHFGASLEEQIDGLLHDASHTVFSHVGDYLFKHHLQKTSYQDEIHEWYLDTVGVTDILRSHGFEHACSKQAKKRHRCLEQDKPDLCADRIDYNLEGGFLDGLLTHQDITKIIQSLHFESGTWFFDDVRIARQFADVSIYLSEKRWGAAWNVCVDYCASKMLERAMNLNIIDKQMIHFSIDDAVWKILCSSHDPEIMQWIARIQAGEQSYIHAEPHECDIAMIGKFSGTDPLVQTEQGLMRLSTLDSQYAEEYIRVKENIACGYTLKFIQ